MRGAWIEIVNVYINGTLSQSRTSCEVRGLKYRLLQATPVQKLSHLMRGAWIEITDKISGKFVIRSHLMRGAWIEMFYNEYPGYTQYCRTSCEVRGLK